MFSARSASADNRERLRKQTLRAIPAQPFAERREDYQLPGAIKVQLLRNCGNSFHELADAHERRLYLPRLEMRGREAQESFPSADDEPSYDTHVHWTRCRRFQVPVSVGQPAENVPPVGHDGDEPCDCAARLQILRDESAPAVLVLVLVEIVLAVAAIPVDLRKRCRIEFPVVRDERTAVPVFAGPVLGEFELALDQLGRVFLRPTAPPWLRRQLDAFDIF